jgi:O-antigen ligase
MTPAARAITPRDVFVFLVPALLAVNARYGGRLYLSELLLLAALPFLIAERRFARAGSWPTTLVAAGLVWFWAQVITDLYRGTPRIDLLRGWSNIALTVIDLVVILMLISGQRRRVLIFTAGIAVGYALAYRFNPTPYARDDPWKFGVAIPVTLAIILISCQGAFFRIRILPAAALFMAGILNFGFGFRSLGGVCVLAALYLSAQAFSRRSGSLRVTPTRLAALGIIGISLAALLVTAYGHAARDGFLGAPAAKKYTQESSGNFGVLLGGRPELFASSNAIADSPLIGHGSWAKDPKYTNGLIGALSRNGYKPSGDLLYSIRHSGYLIPSHSFLFQSWVEAGILGGIFWLVVLVLILSTLIVAFRGRPSLSPLVAFLSMLLVWNIFFSPYGADQRLFAMFSVAALLTCRLLPMESRREAPTPHRIGARDTKLPGSRAPAW